MQIAMNENGEPTLICEATKGKRYYCQICKQDVMQRHGRIKIEHFSHFSSHIDKYFPCPDKWQYDGSTYRILWQRKFIKSQIERVIGQGSNRHIADVLIQDYVIEFIHDPITSKVFQERNQYYLQHELKVIWLFDCREVIHPKNRKEDEFCYIYYFNESKQPFKKISYMDNENILIFMQLNEREDGKCIVRVNSAPLGFSLFKTDKTEYSEEEFLQCITTLTLSDVINKEKQDQEKILKRLQKEREDKRKLEEERLEKEKARIEEERKAYLRQLEIIKKEAEEERKRKDPLYYHLANVPSCSLTDMWKPSYKSMIVYQIMYKVFYEIYGENGKMKLNSSRSPMGKTGVFDFENQTFTPRTSSCIGVCFTDDPIWKFVHAQE